MNACVECGNDDPCEGYTYCSDCLEKRTGPVKGVMKDFMAKAPHWLVARLKLQPAYKGLHWNRLSSNKDDGSADGRTRTYGLVDAEVVASGDGDDTPHLIMLDVDVPVAAIPSSTPGHSHLYIGCLASWESYQKLLDALAECGVLEKGYVAASKKRGATFLRLPWIRKGHEREDARRTVEEWLDDDSDEREPDQALRMFLRNAGMIQAMPVMPTTTINTTITTKTLPF